MIRTFFVVAALCLPGAPARANLPEILLEHLVTLSSPLYVTHAGDERLFIVERPGRIRIYRPDTGLEPVSFLDATSLVQTGGEGGMFSVAFHPDYATNGYFYVAYTPTGLFRSAVVRFEVTGDPDVADAGSAAQLLDVVEPSPNHNGGQVAFGPMDGFLYAGFGDGGSQHDPDCLSQDDQSFHGKILRLDVNQNTAVAPFYGIPTSNPFTAANDPGDLVLDEIWAKGFRNPWRFSFDTLNGDLYVGDVGQSTREEVDRQPASSSGGENYGWNVMEGTSCHDASPPNCAVAPPTCFDASYTPPIHDYSHGTGDCSVTGGFPYRGKAIPALKGRYVFSDWCTGNVYVLTEDPPGTWTRQTVANAGFGVTSFGQDVDGELYVTRGNDVLRIVAVNAVPALPGLAPLLIAGALIAAAASALRRRSRAGPRLTGEQR